MYKSLFVDSPYRTAISGAVLKMQEDGQLHNLKEKWWKKMYGGGSCDVSSIIFGGIFKFLCLLLSFFAYIF